MRITNSILLTVFLSLLSFLSFPSMSYSQITGGKGGGGGGKRVLWNSNGVAALCQNTVAATPFSFPGVPGTAAPTPICDSDTNQAYLVFAANTAQTVYLRTELPTDWAGTASVVITAYSTSTSSPTLTAAVVCVSTAVTTNPTFGSTQGITLSPLAASGRSRAVVALTTAGCAATNAFYLKLVVTANAAAALNILSFQVTE